MFGNLPDNRRFLKISINAVVKTSSFIFTWNHRTTKCNKKSRQKGTIVTESVKITYCKYF
jgi:hypothetical protein